MSDKNIYQRVAEVMKQVEYVQKDSEVSTGGGSYKAVSHDMVSAVIRPQLVEQGIVIQVETLQSRLLQEKVAKGQQGYTMHLYSADYAVHFVNIDNPDDRLTVTVNAHANDSGDKAPGKAMSYAVKYAMLKTFTLETGEDEEQRFSDPYSPEQLAMYHDLLENKKAYEFYMFVKSLPPETVMGLVNSFPDGQKVKGKRAAAQLERDGLAAFEEVVQDVKTRLQEQDLSVTEITDEMSLVEKQVLMGRLDDWEINKLKEIKIAQGA